jgi:uncharacterized cupin superfamily protein
MKGEQMPRPNVYDTEFQMERAEMGIKGSLVAHAAGARELGGTVYELAPGGKGFNLHAHYGNEEMFVVLRGTPTMRREDGEEQLSPGDVVVCSRGRQGMHALTNRSQEPALVLAVSTANSPDVVLYPENDTVGVATRNPFAPIPEDGDEGVIALFRNQDNMRQAKS